MAKPRLTVSFPTGDFFESGGWSRALDLARLADRASVDVLRLSDHVIMGKHPENYEWGPFPYPPTVPWLDPLASIAAMAAVTERLRFCTSILIAPLRPAPVLAKMAATIDVLSGGRLELGVGTGWQREEFTASGIDFATRGQLLSDTVAACRALWQPGPVSFESPTVRFEDIWCEPRPVQPDGIPIFFSGTLTPRNLNRIVRWGEGWFPIMTATLDDIARGSAKLREACSAAGRDPGGLRVHARLPVVTDQNDHPDLVATLSQTATYADIGVTDIQLALVPLLASPDDLETFFDRLAEAWADLAGDW
jgi:probable F420-dependent oxidoreductase